MALLRELWDISKVIVVRVMAIIVEIWDMALKREGGTWLKL